MVSTFHGVLVVALFLLPGALATWGFERKVGAWGVGLADRIFRFVAWSAVQHVLAAPLGLLAWREYVHTGRLKSGDLPLWLWPILIGYVLVPYVIGWWLGWGYQHQKGPAVFLVGTHPAPTAWEHLFGRKDQGTVRIRLKGGTYVAGLFVVLDDGRRSYAAGYPHEPTDLWLVKGVVVDRATGEFLLDINGSLQTMDAGLLIRYDEMESLEFFPNTD